MAGTMSTFPYVFILLTLNAVRHVRGQSGSTPGTGNIGTTPGIEEIFKTRCNNFQTHHPASFVNNPYV